jgi:hypothetical protein
MTRPAVPACAEVLPRALRQHLRTPCARRAVEHHHLFEQPEGIVHDKGRRSTTGCTSPARPCSPASRTTSSRRERQAQRYMALAKSEPGSDLEEQWRSLYGRETEPCDARAALEDARLVASDGEKPVSAAAVLKQLGPDGPGEKDDSFVLEDHLGPICNKIARLADRLDGAKLQELIVVLKSQVNMLEKRKRTAS